MSKVRKERRQRKLIRQGREAERVRAEKESVEKALEKSQSDLITARNENAELVAKIDELWRLLTAERAVTARLKGECSALKGDLRTADQRIAVLLREQQDTDRRIALLDNQLENLQYQDRDAAKLRRRLQSAKAELAQRNSELSSLKRQVVEEAL